MIMDQFEQMKVTRQAMNGKMCLMFGGIFLMFSAITSTIMYGINFFMTALEADKGTAEYVELLENAGVGSGLLKGIGICFIAVGIWEAVVGFLSVRNSNRVDKSRFSVKLAISLLITEIVMQVILFFTGLMNLGLLFTAIVLPLFLLCAEALGFSTEKVKIIYNDELKTVLKYDSNKICIYDDGCLDIQFDPPF